MSDKGSATVRDNDAGAGWVAPGRAVFQEFLVDILGGLAPGILLVVGTGFATFPPLLDLQHVLDRNAAVRSGNGLQELVASLARGPATVLFFGCIGLAMVTYVVGHVFYRRDPKNPDRASFRHLVREKVLARLRAPSTSSARRSGRFERLARQAWHSLRSRLGDPTRLLAGAELKELPDELRRDLGAASEQECEFPYPDFAEYLEARGLQYLAQMVSWGRGHRSKLYVNALKMRMMQRYPAQCRQIVHNEAHVRLASGTWYVAGTLQTLSAFGFIVVVAMPCVPALYVRALGSAWPWSTLSSWIGAHFWTLLSPLTVFVVSRFLRRRIERFFHYQRMREVAFVLEIARFAFRNEPELLALPTSKPPPAGAAGGSAPG